MEDPVLEWLDRLDEHWQQFGYPPPLEQWLQQVQHAFQDADDVVTELVRADLDWRLRRRVVASGDRLVSSSLLELPQVRSRPPLCAQLLDDEFVFWCESPRGETTYNFAALAAPIAGKSESLLEQHFLRTAIKHKPVQVQVYMPESSQETPDLICNLGMQLEIGRAQEHEPPTPALLPGDPARLIVAPARNVSISRNQILLKRDQWSTIKIKNQSTKVPIMIGDIKQLQPERQTVAPVPIVITIGKVRIRLQ